MDFRFVSGLALALCLLRPALIVEGRAYRELKVPGYFVFGDSLLDVGTNNFFPNATAKANFAPYGETFFHKPTGRFSDGRNMGDFIAQALRLPFAPPFLQPNASFSRGVNFASAGSGLLNTTNSGTVVTMSLQLQQYSTARALLYKQLGADAAQELISKSIFVIATGSNDFGSGYLSSPEQQKEINATAYITLVVEAYKNTLIELYQLGARKAIVFGIGPLGCSPLARAGNPIQPGECLVIGNQLAVGFNVGLQQLVGALLVALPDFHIVFGNSYDPLVALMAHGDDFGVSNVTAACCGAGFLNAQLQCGKPVPSTLPGVQASVCKQPSRFLFWDVLHPTEHTVKILFNKIWNSNSTIAYPINLKTLFICMVNLEKKSSINQKLVAREVENILFRSLVDQHLLNTNFNAFKFFGLDLQLLTYSRF